MLGRMSTILIATFAVALLLVGCENLPGAGVVQDAAQAAVCESLDSLGSAVGEVSDMSMDASAADVKAFVVRLDEPVQAVRNAAERLNRQELNDLFAAYDDLVATVNNLSDGATLDQAAGEVQTAVAKVQETLDSARSTLDCGQ